LNIETVCQYYAREGNEHHYCTLPIAHWWLGTDPNGGTWLTGYCEYHSWCKPTDNQAVSAPNSYEWAWSRVTKNEAEVYMVMGT